MKVNADFKWTSNHKKKVAGGLAVVALIIIAALFAACSNDSKKSGNTDAKESASPNTEAAQDAAQGSDELQKNVNESINTLVKNYMTACKEGKLEDLQKLVSNGEELTKEQVQKPYEYVEKIQNIDCYTLNGPDEGSFLVYVYYELKFVNVDTVAPGLMQLFVSHTSDNTLVIMLDELDQHVEEAREAALNREDVKSLIATVNANLTEAANKDADLKALIAKMNAQDTAKATAAPASTQAPQTQATTAPATKAPAATKAPEATKAAQ